MKISSNWNWQSKKERFEALLFQFPISNIANYGMYRPHINSNCPDVFTIEIRGLDMEYGIWHVL